MTVIEEARALFSVTTQSGSEYTVDLREGVCSCPDYRNREPEGGCKHLRRTRMVVGQVDIDALEARFAVMADDLDANATNLEQKAQELADSADELRDALDRLGEVA
jgi:predicted nucleic acid-binding Zn finger protein